MKAHVLVADADAGLRDSLRRLREAESLLPPAQPTMEAPRREALP